MVAKIMIAKQWFNLLTWDPKNIQAASSIANEGHLVMELQQLETQTSNY